MATRHESSITDTTRWTDIAASLSDATYRHAFVEQEIKVGVPFQIRALRVQRGWSQKKLGEKAGGMAQETISLLENPNYGRMNISTLLRLAAAFDVGLTLRFVQFSSVVDWAADMSANRLEVPSYEDDIRLHSTNDLGPRSEATDLSIQAQQDRTAGANLNRLGATGDESHYVVRREQTAADTVRERAA
jgi:transcriptional regulator with XRE-family HTH domain